MEAFLTVILITVAAFWVLGQLGKFLLRWWLQKKQREFARQFGGDGAAYGQQRSGAGTGRQRQNRPEGDVKVHGQRPKKVNSNVGDYVEYEEVETEETVN